MNLGDSRIYACGKGVKVERLTLDDPLEEAVGIHDREQPHIRSVPSGVIELALTTDESHDVDVDVDADTLVAECATLCSINVDRSEGKVHQLIQNGHSGFATGPYGQTFFSMESVYGGRRPTYSSNSPICYSRFPGLPQHRGDPIVVID